MTTDENIPLSAALMRLRVAADADPGALPRILGLLQNLNVVPRRVVAELATTAVLHIQVDLSGLVEARAAMLAAKIGQSPSVLNAYWHYL